MSDSQAGRVLLFGIAGIFPYVAWALYIINTVEGDISGISFLPIILPFPFVLGIAGGLLFDTLVKKTKTGKIRINGILPFVAASIGGLSFLFLSGSVQTEEQVFKVTETAVARDLIWDEWRILVDEAEALIRDGDVDQAIEKLNTAESLNNGMSAKIRMNDQQLGNICWHGSLWGFAEQVYEYCEQAVGQYSWGVVIESRGLARALIGDREGAIEDFERVLSSPFCDNLACNQKRREWLQQLREGINPFNAATLEELKNEGH